MVFSSGLGMTILVDNEVTVPTDPTALAALVMVAVLLLWATCMSASRWRLSPIAAVGALIVVTMLFTLWYARWWPALEPYSDNAEALEIGARQVLSWADPWAVPTSLGNPLSPMLGGFLLAVPFVLLPIQWGM